MKIWNQHWQNTDTITKALSLNPDEQCLIGTVGAGGKTTLLYRLAAELAETGKRVILTTTTHMWKTHAIPMICGDDKSAIIKHLKQERLVLVGWQDTEHEDKISGVTSEQLLQFKELADVVLVEADGSKQYPFKTPAAWEPVGVELCDLVIGVVGIDAVGQSFKDGCHRAEEACALLEKDLEQPITVEDIADIMCSTAGTGKDIRGEYRILINKVDSADDLENAKRLGDLLQAQGMSCAYSSLREETAMILLAAGNSSRFQSNKLLYPIKGKPMYRHIVELSLELPVKKRVLVTQYEEIADDVRALLKDREKASMTEAGCELIVIHNPHPELGISYSIRLGVQAAGEVDAYLFSVCDQPYLEKKTLLTLLEAHQNSPKGIAAVCCGERMGNPNVFSSYYKKELCALEGDVGGKTLMKHHTDDVVLVPIKNMRELDDVDERTQVEEG